MIGEANGKAVKIVRPLLQALPKEGRYKVLFMERPVEEIARSQRQMLDGHSAELPDADELPRLIDGHRLTALRMLDSDSERFNLLRIPYRGLIEDSELWLGRVASFLSLGSAEIEPMLKVIQPDLYRQRTEASVDLADLRAELAFNGQTVRRQIFGGLLEAFKPELFVETAAHFGDTSLYVAEQTGWPVESCENRPEFHSQAPTHQWLDQRDLASDRLTRVPPFHGAIERPERGRVLPSRLDWTESPSTRRN